MDSWYFVLTSLESKESFSKEEACFPTPPFILLASYEPPDPAYTDFHVLVHKICRYISTESDLKLIWKGSLVPSVTWWFIFWLKSKMWRFTQDSNGSSKSTLKLFHPFSHKELFSRIKENSSVFPALMHKWIWITLHIFLCSKIWNTGNWACVFLWQ